MKQKKEKTCFLGVLGKWEATEMETAELDPSGTVGAQPGIEQSLPTPRCVP